MHSSLQILVPVIVLTASMSHNVIAQHSQFDVKTIEQTTAEFQQATDSIRVKRSHRAAYLGMINAGTLTNAVVDGSGTTIFTFRTIHGVQLDNIVSFGLGIGYERFANATLIPLFLDLRVYIPKGGIAPFLFLDGGHSMATNESGNISSAVHFMMSAVVSEYLSQMLRQYFSMPAMNSRTQKRHFTPIDTRMVMV